jgi:glutamyl-tRNA reductase
VPRDFEAAVNDLDGVYLYDIDSLQQIADESMAVRKQEVAVCERLIARHVAEFTEWLAAGPRPPAALRPQTEGGKP